MKAFFSWLRKSADDADRVSSAAAALFCLVSFAGTAALLARTPPSEPEDGAETADASPARISVRLADFVPAPEPPAETENAPEETPPAPEVPAPPKDPEPEPDPPPEIDENALRETVEEPPPEEEPPPPEEPKPQSEPEPPEETRPPQEAAPPPETRQEPVPAPPQIDEAAEQARAAAEQSVYGMLADAIRRKKFYPKAARRTGRTGTVGLRVKIDAAGKIAEYSLHGKGCAHRTLEDGALETLRRVREDFRVPAEHAAALPAVFVVPVVYELN